MPSSFHRFTDAGGCLAGWLIGCSAGWLAGWLLAAGSDYDEEWFRRLLKRSSLKELDEISGVGGSQPVAAFAAGVLPLKNPLLDRSWLLFHRIVDSSMLAAGLAFHRCLGVAGRLAGLLVGWLRDG